MVLAAGLCAYHAGRAVMISPDSAVFIQYARELGESPLNAMRTFDQHPLYSTMIAFAHPLTRALGAGGADGWIVAGRAIAVIGLLGAVLASYALARACYDARVAGIAAVLTALLPDAARFGTDVLSDLPHLALYLSALALGLSAVQRRCWARISFAGAASGLAFLTRPEGGAAVVVTAVLALAHWRGKFRERFVAGCVALAAFFAVAGPYQFVTGSLIQKKSIFELFQLASGRSGGCGPLILAAASPVWVPVEVLYQWLRAGRVVFLVPAVVGIFVARPGLIAGRVLLLAIGVHLTLLHALEASFGYVDRRHALILAVLSMPTAAAAIDWIAQRVADGALRRRLVVGQVAACALCAFPWLLRPINAGEEHVAATARWIRAQTPASAIVVGDSRMHRVALLAERGFVEWPWWGGDVEALARFLSAAQTPRWFLVDVAHMTSQDRNPRFFEAFAARFANRAELVHVEPSRPHARATEIRVFLVRPR